MSDQNPFVAQFNEHADYGVAYSRRFTYLDEAGDPIDVDAMTVQVCVRQSFNETPVLTTADFTTATDASGHVDISCTAAKMETVASAQYAEWEGVFDVLLLSGGNPAVKLVTGTFTIHPTASTE